MLKSMTGFGRGEAVLNSRRFIVEIKTVNNRHRDLIVRLPRTLQAIEDEVRSQVSAVIRSSSIGPIISIGHRHLETAYQKFN